MENQIEFMLYAVPTLIGAMIIVFALFSSYGPMLEGYLQIMSLSSVMNTFFRNVMEPLKYLMGPGG